MTTKQTPNFTATNQWSHYHQPNFTSWAQSSRGKGKNVKVTSSGSRKKVSNNEFNTHNFKLFEKKSIIEGRFVDFGEFRELNIERLFEVLGWKAFIKVKVVVYPRLVKAFYAHMQYTACENNIKITCTLKGQRI